MGGVGEKNWGSLASPSCSWGFRLVPFTSLSVLQTLFTQGLMELFEVQRAHMERCMSVFTREMPDTSALRDAIETVRPGSRVFPKTRPLS